MSNPQGQGQEQTPSPADDVHDAATWARANGHAQLARGLDALAAELGYVAPTPEGESAGESGALATP